MIPVIWLNGVTIQKLNTQMPYRTQHPFCSSHIEARIPTISESSFAANPSCLSNEWINEEKQVSRGQWSGKTRACGWLYSNPIVSMGNENHLRGHGRDNCHALLSFEASMTGRELIQLRSEDFGDASGRLKALRTCLWKPCWWQW